VNERIEIPIHVALDEGPDFHASFEGKRQSFNTSFGNVEKISTGNYEDLFNKPIINGHTIIGDKVSNDYDLQDKLNEITPQMIDNLFYGR